jgi:tRNA dimethylallyltransferase
VLRTTSSPYGEEELRQDGAQGAASPHPALTPGPAVAWATCASGRGERTALQRTDGAHGPGGRSDSAAAQRLIAVVGPTGSGKTELAIRLAERFAGEILNTDSLQVYRTLDIGTAKPGAAERARVPHHLLDVVDPDEAFSAGDYVRAARAVLADLAARGRVPILCGGTGLYFRALLQGISDIPDVPPAVRSAVAAQLAQRGAPALHARLAEVDPAAAARIHPHDAQRIARALEVFEASGRPLSVFQAAQPFAAAATLRSGESPVQSVGFAYERPELYRRIDARVERMLGRGLIEEVRGILARGYAPGLKPLRSIGYLEAVAHLQGRLLLAEVAPAIQLRTRHYAKRQITWFKRHPNIAWAEPGDFAGVEVRVGAFLAERGG